MKSILTILLIFMSCQIAHSKTIGCTHPQICNLLQALLPNNKVILLKKIKADPHHDKLTAQELKHMLNVDILVLAPVTLQKWSARVAEMKPTAIKLSLPLHLKGISAHAMAHFWLYPPQLQAIAQELQNKLIAHQLTIKPWNKKLLNQLDIRFKKLQPCLYNKTIVLSHDALKALFANYFPSTKVIILRQSDHFLTYSLKALKQLQQKLNKCSNKQIIWIREKQISIPNLIQQWLHSKQQINFNPLGEVGTPVTQPLQDLAKQLEQQCH